MTVAIARLDWLQNIQREINRKGYTERNIQRNIQKELYKSTNMTVAVAWFDWLWRGRGRVTLRGEWPQARLWHVSSKHKHKLHKHKLWPQTRLWYVSLKRLSQRSAQSSTVDKVKRYGRNGIRTSELLEKQFFHDWLWSVNRGDGQLASVTIQRRQWTILERYLNNIWTQARMFRCAGQIVFGENRCGRCLECQVQIVSGQD